MEASRRKTGPWDLMGVEVAWDCPNLNFTFSSHWVPRSGFPCRGETLFFFKKKKKKIAWKKGHETYVCLLWYLNILAHFGHWLILNEFLNIRSLTWTAFFVVHWLINKLNRFCQTSMTQLCRPHVVGFTLNVPKSPVYRSLTLHQSLLISVAIEAVM